MRISYTLALVGALVAIGTSGAFASQRFTAMSNEYVGDRSQAATETSAQTIDQLLKNGTLTMPEVQQMVAFTGLTPDQAKKYTVAQVVEMRWTNN